ncbi:FKBP-type peptidyl-prolyl cis-trans isomerase [Aestuariirhabdus litorea]|uniref:Peptidyl-prolyl cis-trans isomerase n=1 Tax=Aestuariirhabdus litorea TaxID=2528527 RepID=A0A3P3VKI5_9GAMM|nr:FKBP-type peptidyl-prolyl cis-trans isomerase [Aestuariirhabdus litorea]RRJ83251.1 peptidylprolyl isomerase [Aestuariirhabdus litorea]RWW93410.1 peptidylprolyl isomerase [Endozoicomonadaceae bacterium GTF-13]
MSDLCVGPDRAVTLHFSLKLEDGSEVDSTFDKAPATLTMGDGSLPEGFESLLHGLAIGAREQFSVAPEAAFGERNPANVQRMPRTRFGSDIELSEGVMLSFADQGGAELPGVVTWLSETVVEVDFNHPLAGHRLLFEVEIIDVQPAA